MCPIVEGPQTVKEGISTIVSIKSKKLIDQISGAGVVEAQARENRRGSHSCTWENDGRDQQRPSVRGMMDGVVQTRWHLMYQDR